MFKKYLNTNTITIILFIITFFLLIKILIFSDKNNIKPLTLTPKNELSLVSKNEINTSYAPAVPKAIQRKEQSIFDVHLEVLENICDIDSNNNIKFDVWGYRIKGDDKVLCGAPGPILRGRVGDIARITLTNIKDNKNTHNIDFHSVTGQGGGASALTVLPGETKTIEIRLLYPGTFMYHCAFGDVPEHIAHGMYGMFIVDPEKPLPEVDHEWAIMQSEWYLDELTSDRVNKLDHIALLNEEPNIITFNGKKNALLNENSLSMNTGERSRIYFVNQGLSLASNFHPIGSHWDLVYPEGATHSTNNTIYGSQSTLVVAGGGTVVELVARVPSYIILVDHALTRAFYKGAMGIINVSGEENKEIFEAKVTKETTEEINEENKKFDIEIVKDSYIYDNNKLNDYAPYEFIASVGDTITWINDDDTPHTVTANDYSFDSGTLRKGDTWSYTFTEPGTYNYFCEPHPWMEGVIIVK